MIRYSVRRTALAVVVAASVSAHAAAQSRAGGGGESGREAWQKVADIFEAMQVRPGAVVADIGAGDGFFTTRLSKAVGGEGRVHAVDVAADALGRLRKRVATDGLANVTVVEGAVDDPGLPPGSLDAILIVNAYHEMTRHEPMLAKMRAALKPGGRLVIVEPIAQSRREKPRQDQTRNHEIAAEFVRADAKAAGFTEVALHDPFTTRPHNKEEEWMLVLTPAANASPAPSASAEAAPVFSSRNEDWKAPELRITMEEFKRQAAAGSVLVVDVRDPQSYRQGHLPGAILMTPEELSIDAGAARLRGERRLIVAYCS
jgi:predicted methyltransferase